MAVQTGMAWQMTKRLARQAEVRLPRHAAGLPVRVAFLTGAPNLGLGHADFVPPPRLVRTALVVPAEALETLRGRIGELDGGRCSDTAPRR